LGDIAVVIIKYHMQAQLGAFDNGLILGI